MMGLLRCSREDGAGDGRLRVRSLRLGLRKLQGLRDAGMAAGEWRDGGRGHAVSRAWPRRGRSAEDRVARKARRDKHFVARLRMRPRFAQGGYGTRPDRVADLLLRELQQSRTSLENDEPIGSHTES